MKQPHPNLFKALTKLAIRSGYKAPAKIMKANGKLLELVAK